MLVASRALQGVGAAMVAPAALSIVTTSFPEGRARTRVLEYERRSAEPLMPLSIFRSHTLAAGDGVSLLAGAWTAAEVLLLSLFCQQVLGYSALLTGLVVVPQGVAGLLRGFFGATIVARMGVKRFLTTSAAIAAVGLGLLVRFPVTSRYPLLGVVLFIVGIGNASTVFAATIAGTAGVADDEQGLASALLNAARQVGSAIGVSTGLAIAAADSRAQAYPGSVAALAHGYRLGMGVCAVLAVAATLLSIVGIREPVCREHQERLRERHLDHPWPLPEFLGHR